MLQKVSKPFSKTRQSQLVWHYVNACNKIYGKKPFVHKSLFPKFAVFEDDLREQGISSRDYAYTVAKLLEKFTTDKGWKYPPPRLFLSDYGLKRYKRVDNTETVNISVDDKEAILFHDELLVARAFIDRNVSDDNDFHRMTEIVDDLRPLLSDIWLQVYINKAKRPIMDVIDTLTIEYGISENVTTYLDIISVLR